MSKKGALDAKAGNSGEPTETTPLVAPKVSKTYTYYFLLQILRVPAYTLRISIYIIIFTILLKVDSIKIHISNSEATFRKLY